MAEAGPSNRDWRWPAWAWGLLLLALMASYFIGLDGQHIPKNGDEFVYAHIARLTALTGEWLPLQSSFEHMRNTKPPPLFWQAMVAGDWYRNGGEAWTLWNLRLPGVLYTLATALMAGAVAWRLAAPDRQADPWRGGDSVHGGGSSFFSGVSRPSLAPQRFATGALAALLFLAFFSTYRNGRPYLTSGPETFWLFLPFAAIAWAPQTVLRSNLAFPLAAGVAVGLGCLYKSFALVVPVAAALGACHLLIGQRPWRLAHLAAVAWRVGLSSVVALGLFALWFVVDPQPGEVWREFVVGENAGKFKSAEGFWARFLSGPNSIWMMLINYPLNSGLLLFVTVGLVGVALRQARRGRTGGAGTATAQGELALWLWLLVLLVIFSAPSQRSARYLLPAMPGLAVLMALYWGRIARTWFVLTLLLALGAVAVVGLIARGAVQATGDPALYTPLFWVGLVSVALLCAVGLVWRRASRPVVVLVATAVLPLWALLTLPFDGPIARFDAATLAKLQGQTVAVPSNFNGQFERYEFLIRGAKIKDYFAEQPTEFKDLAPLLAQHRYVLLQRRLGTPREQVCLGVPGCRIVAERWDIRSRHTRAETARNALQQPGEFWFAKEYLLERAP